MNPWSYPYGQALRFFNESNESMNPTFNIVAELSFNESSQLKLLNLNLNEWFYWALSCHSNSIFPSFKEPLNCFGWEKTSRACGRRLCSLKRKKREQSFAARWSVLIKIAFFRPPSFCFLFSTSKGQFDATKGAVCGRTLAFEQPLEHTVLFAVAH